MTRRLLVLIAIVASLVPGAAAQTPITDPFIHPPSQETTPACVVNLRASLVSGLASIEWDHDYNLPMRAQQNADFVVYRATANFQITTDEEGFIWLANYPQFAELARFDAETQEDYLDTSGVPGTTYRYFVSYYHGIPADRCNYVEIGPPGTLGTASEEASPLRVPGSGVTALIIASVAMALLWRRELR